MATADEFLSQYEPDKAAVSADDFLASYAPEEKPAAPSFFGSNRGVAAPNSNSPDDYIKSSAAAAEKLPFWVGDMTDALTKGITRLGGAAYQGLGGDLTPEQAEALTNPKSVHTSQELYQNAGIPLYQPKTSLGTLADLAMSAAGGMASPEVADILASKGIAEINPNSFIRSNSSISKATPVVDPITADVLKDTSQKAYKFAEDQGGKLNGDFSGDVRAHLEEAKIQPVGQKPLTKSAQAFNNKIDELMPLEGEEWTLDDFQKFDKLLTREKVGQMDGFAHTPDSRALSIAQQKIRDRLQGLVESDVVGGKAGFDALTQEAIPVWSAKTKMDDLERIINRANAMDNPSIAMRTGFRNLMLNKAKMASYPKDVQALIKKAATQTKTDDILGVLGSRLNAIGAGVSGGLPGELLGHASSAMFRGIRNSRINNRADSVVDALTEPLRPIVNKYKNPPAAVPQQPAAPMLMLPAPKSTVQVNGYGQGGLITPATREILGQSPSTLAEKTPAEVAAATDFANQSQSELGKKLGATRMLGNENAQVYQPEHSAAQANQILARADYEKAMAQKQAQDTVPTIMESTGGKSIEDLVSGNADRNDLGTMAQAFMNLGKNERGNLGVRGSIAGGLAGGAALALRNKETPKQTVMSPVSPKYKTMDELMQSIPELKTQEIPKSFQNEEGFRPKVYPDTTGHKTVGIGFNMDSKVARDAWKSAGIAKDFNAVRAGKQSITKNEANTLLQKSYDIAKDDIKKLVPNIDNLSEKQQEGLHQLAFQMGRGSLKENLPGVIAMAKAGNMRGAAVRLMASDYAKTYKNRAARIAKMMAG